MKTSSNGFKKVLHIIDGFGTGGAETWLLQVAKYVADNAELGLHVDFVCTGGEVRTYDEEVLRTGSRIFYIKYSAKNFFSFRSVFKKLLITERYDGIHDHQDFVSGWHFLAGLGYLPSIRISHLHNPFNFVRNYITGPGRWISYKLGRFLMFILSTHISATSNAVMDEYRYNHWPYKLKRVDPAYCGFDVQRFAFDKDARKRIRLQLGWGESCKIGIFIGRIGLQSFDTGINQKNPEFALKVAKHLVIHHNWKFVFVGDKGISGSRMENEIVRDGLNSHIKFLGAQKDISSLMSASDLLLFPSYWEGLGMVLVEAQANGLPSLAADTISKEAVVNKKLVAVKSLDNSVEDWCDQALTMSNIFRSDPQSNSIVFNSPFSIYQSVMRLKELYEVSKLKPTVYT